MLGQDKGALHEINDQLDVVRPITKWCRRVLKVQEIPEAIHEAMRQMQTGRPRPTVVEIPPDVLAATADVALSAPQPSASSPLDREAVRRAADLLATAKKPLIWAGGGVMRADASRELRELAEALDAPVATTSQGKGALPEDHPLALGVGYSGHGAPTWAVPLADVILAVGTRLTGQMRGLTALRQPQRLIHLDADATVIGKNYPAEVSVVGDAKSALQAFGEAVRARKSPEGRWPHQELEKIRKDADAWVRQRAPFQCEIIDQLQGVLSDEAIIVSGITSVAYWSHFALHVRRPRSYLTASYYATLGFEYATALGAKVAAPDRPVITLVGDGGFMYGLAELATAVQYGIKVVAIVFVDGAFGASKADQQGRFRGRVIGTEFHNPDFALVAEAFGAKGIKTEPEHVGKALREALVAEGPVVIEVPIPTLVPPFQIPPRQGR